MWGEEAKPLDPFGALAGPWRGARKNDETGLKKKKTVSSCICWYSSAMLPQCLLECGANADQPGSLSTQTGQPRHWWALS